MIIKNDKALGVLAVERGLITQTQLDECIQAQEHIAKVGCHKRLGEIILEKGVLTSRQMLELLKLQRTRYQQRYFAGYQLHATLGEGGMGKVYWATRTRDGLRVALKVLSKEVVKNEGAVERFYRESQVALSLRHPNLIRAYEYGCHKSRYYLALEFVRGWTVAQHIVEQGPMPQTRAMLAARQVGLALTYMDERGIVHRDVKPSNIMLTAHNQAKLLDYGLARQVASSGQRITLTGQVVGTPDFMSPEQILGKHIDHRSDVYSLGATLYSMVTGRAPYEDLEGQNAIFMGHLKGDYPNPIHMVPDLNRGLAHVIAKAMRIEVKTRYQHVNEMIADLDAVLAGEVPPSRRLEDSAAVRRSSRIERVKRRSGKQKGRKKTGKKSDSEDGESGAAALLGIAVLFFTFAAAFAALLVVR